jgi:hypothetical protein
MLNWPPGSIKSSAVKLTIIRGAVQIEELG